jgi:hypothetical protein
VPGRAERHLLSRVTRIRVLGEVRSDEGSDVDEVGVGRGLARALIHAA